MEDVRRPRECVFFGHGNVQHAGGGWEINHWLWYHLYLIPKDVDLKDAVTSAYGDSMQRNVQNKREIFLCDLDPYYLSNEKERAADNVSRNTTIMDMT